MPYECIIHGVPECVVQYPHGFSVYQNRLNSDSIRNNSLFLSLSPFYTCSSTNYVFKRVRQCVVVASQSFSREWQKIVGKKSIQSLAIDRQFCQCIKFKAVLLCLKIEERISHAAVVSLCRPRMVFR